jgi:hypothetical protein
MAPAGGYLHDAGPRSLSASSGTCHDWDRTSLDKLSRREFSDTDVPTQVDELDSPLRNQARDRAATSIRLLVPDSECRCRRPRVEATEV